MLFYIRTLIYALMYLKIPLFSNIVTAKPKFIALQIEIATFLRVQ